MSDASIAHIINQYDSYTTSQSDADFASLISAIEQLGQQGVDLTLLPKQLMSYADRHFNENRQLYTTISTLSSQLLSQAKRYPHPLLLYKTLLYNTRNEQGTNNEESQKKPVVVTKDKEIQEKSS